MQPTVTDSHETQHKRSGRGTVGGLVHVPFGCGRAVLYQHLA
jgi:hypothetical protein